MDSTSKKAFHILERLASNSTPMGITEIGRELSLTKSNVHRVLATLMELGYVEQAPGTLYYRPTLRAWEVGIQVRARNNLWRVAQTQMRLLHKETGETIYLTKLIGDEVLFIDRIEGDYPIRTHPLEGIRTPLYATANGKALLAFLEVAALERILSNLAPVSNQTITDPTTLRKELEQVRSRGYALSRGEWRTGINAVAAPIRNREQQLLGAISIAGPSERMTDQALEQHALTIMNSATLISSSF